MTEGTPIIYYCPVKMIEKDGNICLTQPVRMELAKDYNGGEYCWVRSIGTDTLGTETRWKYITLVFT